MGIFSFFKRDKEAKENLNKGLEKTRTSVFDRISKAIIGKSTVDDEVLDNLEEILVTSDVGVDTTLKIIDRIQKRVARDKYLGTSELNSILKEEIASLLQENNSGDGISRPRTETITTGSAQLSFFQLDDPILCQVRDELLNIDVNSLTPLEALNKLNDIKKIIKGK